MIDRIVIVQSAAFTGSTWLCYILASHPKSFSLGNPGKAWDLYSQRKEKTCRVHYNDCPFWKKITRADPGKTNFLTEICEQSGCSTLVLYNPRDEPFLHQTEVGELANEVVRVKVTRDIRQRYASWKRRNQGKTVIEGVKDFLTSPSYHNPSGYTGNDVVELRHELLSSDPDYVVSNASRITGLTMDHSALTYWNHEHHPAHGNGVTHSTCRYFQCPESNRTVLDPVYVKYLTDVEQGTAFEFSDNRWETEIDPFERYVIDRFAGEENSASGYERDVFDPISTDEYSGRLQRELG